MDGYIHNEICDWHKELSEVYGQSEWDLFIEEGGPVGCMAQFRITESDEFGIPNIYGISEKYFGESLLPLAQIKL